MSGLSEEEFGPYGSPERVQNLINAVRTGRVKTHTEDCKCRLGQVGCTRDEEENK